MSFLLSNGVKCTLFRSTQQLHPFKPLRCVNTFENFKEKGKGLSIKSDYHPCDVEANWYEFWESKNYFKPSKLESDSYIVILPPPNITGTLHLGHALTCTIQDVILRWKRMKGESVLWVPGIDHAGIATQVAVEKHLIQSSGLSRHDLGRDEFVKSIWEWKNEKAEKIINQLRKMGASLDWSRLIFTLDPSHSHLVNKSFIQLFNEGLIYRKESLVNWSCALKSSISDIEVDWITIDKKMNINVPGYDKPVGFGSLYEFAYKVCNEDLEIVVSTTRPETVFGDVAVAIHPDNPNTSKFKGKYVWSPFRNEKIPIIVDDFVDPNFGTGAVKITPAHSLIDFEVGLRHNLGSISVINEEGFIINAGTSEEFLGLKRFDARWAVIKKLKNLNLFRGIKSASLTLPVCSRSGDVVEYLLKDQWFLKSNSLIKKAFSVVKDEKLKLQPASYKNVWYNWLGKPSRDWNLSRQLWWGHQIPMYKCEHKEKSIWVPGLSLEEVKTKASEMFGAAPGDIKIVQDPDVLDTWFSSGLLSLNTMINQSRCPTISLMVTGHDILFFWLARMVMLSIQLTGELPFKEAFLHGLICDAKGKKMSKSIGNVIHPDDIIYGLSKSEMENRLKNSLKEKQITEENFKRALASQNIQFPKGIPECGVDALRFSLCSSNVQSSFVDFDIQKCLANKFFGNKIYQAFNYFVKITDAYKEKRSEFDLEDSEAERKRLNCFDLWILSRLQDIIQCVETNLASYRFDFAANALRLFIINEFCNLYLNTTKSVLKNCSSDQFKTTISVFFYCFETSLRLLSPFMPFLTEYLYQAMPLLNGYDKYESITIAKFPNSADWSKFRDLDLESRFQKLSDFLTDLRRTKILFNLKSEKPKVFIKCPDNLAEVLFGKMEYVFADLGEVDSLTRIVNFERNNIIQQEIDEDFIIFIEHNYDKSTLLSLLEPTIKKEKELKQNLDKLLKTTSTPEWEEKLPSEKYEHNKQINSLNLELKKIENLKFTVDNCNR